MKMTLTDPFAVIGCAELLFSDGAFDENAEKQGALSPCACLRAA